MTVSPTGLSRPGGASFRLGEVPRVDAQLWSGYRIWPRIELPALDFLTGLAGGDFSLLGFLPCLRLCPLAGLGFGHVFFAFQLSREPTASTGNWLPERPRALASLFQLLRIL